MDQHFVTKFYLAGFCDPSCPPRHEPSVWCVSLRDGALKRRAPKNVATRSNYYSPITNANGQPDHELEDFHSRIESAAAPVVKRLRAGTLELQPADRQRLVFFIGFLIVRVPSLRGYLERFGGLVGESLLRTAARHREYFARTFRKHDSRLTDDDIERLRQHALEVEKHFVVRGTDAFSLAHGLQMVRPLLDLIAGMRWQWVTAPGDAHFITSDTPVTWRNPKLLPHQGVGLGLRSTELSLPFGPRVCLRGTWTGKTGVVRATDGMIGDLNRERVRHADAFVYADSESGAREALRTYQGLKRAGDAHATPFMLFVVDGADGRVRTVQSEAKASPDEVPSARGGA